MVGVAFALGFRRSATLDDAALARLAEAEGAALEHVLIGPGGKSAFACLSGGKLMIARVMGEDVSARTSPASAARVRLAGGKLSVVFGDLGYPPLNLALAEPPPHWLAALATGETT
jgi:hypothetical protein